MTTILQSYVGWPGNPLMDASDKIMSFHGDAMTLDRSSSSSSPISSSSNSPRLDSHDCGLPSDLRARQSMPSELIDFAAGITPGQFYALQHNLLQRQLMLHQLASPVPVLNPQPHLPFVHAYSTQASTPMNAQQTSQSSISLPTSHALSDTLIDLPEPNRQAKRRRADRSSWTTEGDESDESDSDGMDRGIKKKAKLNGEPVAETILSDITDLLSLPQKEAAQRLGISESMLCKRFKECTRRKWPFRYLRKIEKTIATLESQKILEPLSVEDQDRLEDLLKQRIECLAPVKIRITKSPSPVPGATGRSATPESDSVTTGDEEEESDDHSSTEETDYESEAVEKLIDLSRCGSPRSFFAMPQIAC